MPQDVSEETMQGSADEGATPSYERLAFRYVSRARKRLDLRNLPADQQAEFLMSAAQIYALLDLADALRNSRGL
jgi:hypothetical protein